jgi:hypothetical protein
MTAAATKVNHGDSPPAASQADDRQGQALQLLTLSL